jgi:hypothetical protein
MAPPQTSTYSPLETDLTEAAEARAVEVLGLPSVLVKAPSDLPGGYHLCVEINGNKTFVAIVRTNRNYTGTILNLSSNLSQPLPFRPIPTYLHTYPPISHTHTFFFSKFHV